MKSVRTVLFRRYSFVFLIVLYFLITRIFFSSTPQCEKEKATHFMGRVSKLTEDPESGGVNKLIYLTNGIVVNPAFTRNLWILVNEGDSLVKEDGKLNYEIYDKNGFLDTIVKWDIPCK